MAALLVACGCGSCPEPQLQCPNDVLLTVTSPMGTELTGVSATVAGSQLTCWGSPTGAVCNGGGSGLLHVEAPGFQPLDVESTVTEAPAPHCGCPAVTREPATVTLEPA